MFKKSQIIKCTALQSYNLKILFADGFEGIVNLSHLAGKGVFKIWNDYEEFKKVKIDPKTKTICWAGDIDLDPINIRQKLEVDAKNQNLKLKNRV